jgi:NTP pyrophosphatase (non-canonical NTP hydrolase)
MAQGADLMTLDDLFTIQAKQQGLWYDRDLLTDSERAAMMDELLHGLNEEVTELARELRRKPHVVRQERGAKGNAVEEVVDVLKYTLAIAHLANMAPALIAERFLAKTDDVEQKFHQYRLELEGRRVFVTDLDSCVADLANFFKATGGQYGHPTAGTLSTEELKAQWYTEGGFKTLTLIDGAREVLQEAQAAGCLVAIVTARPVWEHARVRPDTVQWLRAMGVPCDILLFNKDKWDAIHQSILPARVIAFVEDRDKHVMELVGHRVEPILLMDQPWNQNCPRHQTVHRVWSWKQVRHAMVQTSWGREFSNKIIIRKPERLEAQ